MAYKPAVPKGTRDFSPEILERRYHIFDTIRSVYELFGFMPIETPSMELLETLTGKYGAEGDKLLFRILNSGDFLKGVDQELLRLTDSAAISPAIAEKGLRYDLTVPFARYVVQHRNEITLPFKRYQIQPVWRADRPQKGRYREFYQCDADVIGSDALINEAELVNIIDEVFTKLGIGVDIRLNNRKILFGLSEASGISDRFIDFTVAIDKLDKVGSEKVLDDLSAIGVDDNSLTLLASLFSFRGSNHEKLNLIEDLVSASETGLKGVAEMRKVLSLCDINQAINPVLVDITLARGLNYYTGTIFEVTASDVSIGSVCGGGRYDDLTGIFGMPGLSGVGISFGADRIYDVMQELNLFDQVKSRHPQVLFVNFGNEDEAYSLKALASVRKAGIAAEIYPEPAKIKKQMAYADARKIPFVVLAGEKERTSRELTLKNMTSGEQETVTLESMIKTVNR
jgi:histidyl-tRNA synthetase